MIKWNQSWATAGRRAVDIIVLSALLKLLVLVKML